MSRKPVRHSVGGLSLHTIRTCRWGAKEFRRVVRSTIALLTVVVWAQSDGTADEISDPVSHWHREAVRAFDEGDFRASIASWEKALAVCGGASARSVVIRANLAQAYVSLGNPTLAASSLAEAERAAREIGDRELVIRVRTARAGIRGGLTRWREPAGEAGEYTESAEGRKWAAGVLDELVARIRSPWFSELTPSEQRELLEMLRTLAELRGDTLSYLGYRIRLARNEGRREKAMRILRDAEAQHFGQLLDSSPERTLVERFVPYIEHRLELASAYVDIGGGSSFSDYRRVLEETIRVVDRLRRLASGTELPAGQERRLAEMYRSVAVAAQRSSRDADDSWGQYALSYGHAADQIARRLGPATDSEAVVATRAGRGIRFDRARRNQLVDGNPKFARMYSRFFLPTVLEVAHSELLAGLAERGSTAREKRFSDCLELLASADELAEILPDPEFALEVKRARGAVAAYVGTSVHQLGREPSLLAGLAVAERNSDYQLGASVLNDLGTLLADRGLGEVAAACFEGAATHAADADEDELVARTAVNLARLSGREGDLARAAGLVDGLGEGHAQIVLSMSLGDISSSSDRIDEAFQRYTRALHVAQDARDYWGISVALGKLGELYLEAGRYDESLQLSQRALFLAQGRIVSQDLAFRWTWQAGRALRGLGEEDDALRTYLRAEKILRSVRRDLLIDYSGRDAGHGFRNAIGSFFFELADLHFARARELPGGARHEQLLAARRWVEQFKALLLEDYFRDRSITNYRQTGLAGGREAEPKLSVQTVASKAETPTAVIYPIPMRDRVEILAEIDGTIYWRTSEVSGAELDAAADRMRVALDPLWADLSNSEHRAAYLEPAKVLYDSLVGPFEDVLSNHGVETLVFVPEGRIRSIPVAALHDGRQHLVERFSLAIVPDLLMMGDEAEDPKRRGTRHPLLAGLSKGVQGFAPLPGVSDEIDAVSAKLHARVSEIILDEGFTKRSFAAKFGKNYDLLHIASHANFSSDLEDTFVLTFDDRLFPADLERSVRRLAFRRKPLEMLVLSACETAAGDDRAALGLAGIAVKSGAHSVIASLWAVEDQATSALITAFYRNLFTGGSGDGDRTSKAEALRLAQLEVMGRERWSHPQHWAAFAVIGNWLAADERLEIYGKIRKKRETDDGR